jgi:hypothetical protein
MDRFALRLSLSNLTSLFLFIIFFADKLVIVAEDVLLLLQEIVSTKKTMKITLLFII